MLGNRGVKQIVAALGGRQHYIALFNMMRRYPRFGADALRYLTARGDYPYDIAVRTPRGLVRPRLYSHHDLLTVNEIFCRGDYAADATTGVVVDLGSNIGISALYFLTRNTTSRCFLFEPYEPNIAKLRSNLRGYEGRYALAPVAVADRNGRVEFGVEPTGRYGGIGKPTDHTITVECRSINAVLADVLAEVDHIDILKIDTEGAEVATVEAIAPEHARRIGKIYLEAAPDYRLQPEFFRQTQYGSVCRLTNRDQ